LKLPTNKISGMNRRCFLAGTATLAATAILPSELSSQVADDGKRTPPKPARIPSRGTLLKFTAKGQPRPFAGNTIICHLPAQCAMRDALEGLHEEVARNTFSSKLGLTPLLSYHMTVFPGATDQDRADGWPSYVPSDAPIEVCNRAVGARIAEARLGFRTPIRVRIDEEATMNDAVAGTFHLLPADAQANTNLRNLRDQLSDLYGFRSKGHNTYAFHMTFAYQVMPFTQTEQNAYRQVLHDHMHAIVATRPELQFGTPEFCTFKDMYRFEPEHLLNCG
jgi:hypothetical protein